MTNTEFDGHIFLQQSVENQKTKHIYIRHNENNYECEQFLIDDNGTVSDIEYFPIDKDKYVNLINISKASNPIGYFARKNMGYKAFGEEFISD